MKKLLQQMQVLLSDLISTVIRPYHWWRLRSFTGTHMVRPAPLYLSQFIGIYPSSITPRDTLTNKKHQTKFGAKDAADFTFWAWRSCGIAS